jgi:hypothetical protein
MSDDRKRIREIREQWETEPHKHFYALGHRDVGILLRRLKDLEYEPPSYDGIE